MGWFDFAKNRGGRHKKEPAELFSQRFLCTFTPAQMAFIREQSVTECNDMTGIVRRSLTLYMKTVKKPDDDRKLLIP